MAAPSARAAGPDDPQTRQTGPVPSAAAIERIIPWTARLAWVLVLVVGDPAIDGATADRSDAVRAVARFGGGALWLVGVAAMAIPAVVSLTATRAIVPIAVPVAAATWLTGADPVDSVPMLGVGLLAAVLVFSADFGRAFVQASAYGEEDRHLLRPPPAYAAMSGLTWAVCVAALLTGPLLLAARSWIAGVALTALAIGGVAWSWRRWHRLARRWFVIVPVGLVVHDHLVLAETLMLRRNEITALRLAPADTEAADLTGPAAGHAIEIVTPSPVTAIFAATPSEPRGRAIHLTSCLVGPTRPGRALRSAAARRLPVG